MNKNFVILALLIALASVTIYSTVQLNMPALSSTTSGLFDIGSSVCIYTKSADSSEWVQIGECSHNTMTNSGLNWTRDLIGAWGVGTTAMNYIAVGNGTTAESAALTSLNAEITTCGLARAAGTYTEIQSSVGNWSISKLFTSTCSGIIVNTTALLNASSSGTMFAGKNFDNLVTLQPNDQLNVIWYVWVAGG